MTANLEPFVRVVRRWQNFFGFPSQLQRGCDPSLAFWLSGLEETAARSQVPCTFMHPGVSGCPSLPLSFSPTAKAVSELKDLNYSDKFRETFLPDGQPLLPGMFVRRLDLAAVLELVGAEGISAFYSGNLSQEIISEVSPVC